MIITAFGDTVLSKEYMESFKSEELILLFGEADLVTFNLETAVSDSNILEPADKAVCFRTSIGFLEDFCSSIGKDVVCNVANNHIYDFGEVGYRDTIWALRQKNLGITGEKNQICYKVIGESKIAIIGAFETDEIYLEINTLSSDVEQLIKEAKANADICILHLHWGRELCIAVSPAQVEFAHRCIDTGCDVIIGHHPHVMQHVEEYKNGLIFYSLGNFQIPINPFEKMSQYACGVQLCIEQENDKRKFAYNLLPVYIDERGIPTLNLSKEHLSKWQRIQKEIQYESQNVSKKNYYLNFSTNYIKESMRAWKMRWNNKEKSIEKSFFKWCLSGMAIKACIFTIVDAVIGYNRKRNRRLWYKEDV